MLPDIKVPVGLFCGDRDQFFPQDVVEETVRLVPECTHFRFPGQGHMKIASGRRVVEDMLAFVHRG